MSLILNAQSTAAMNITYSDAISVAMNHPPQEAGAYGVKYFDGSTGSEVWDGKNWLGTTNVAFYSGRPLLLTKEEKKHHVDTILAAAPAKQADQNKLAAASALAMARHYACKVEKNRTGSKVVIHIQNMLGFYLLAQNLGMQFDAEDGSAMATITDKKLLTWARQEIAKKDSVRIEKTMADALKRGAKLQAWIKEVLA